MKKRRDNGPKQYTIYALFDPRLPDAIRYVGFSENPDRRLRWHLDEALKNDGPTHKIYWLRRLLADGVTPWWRKLDELFGTKTEAGARETEWIARCRMEGCDLTNSTAGGDGAVGWSDDVRERHGKRMTEYWSSEEAREGQRQAMRAFWASPAAQVLRAANSETTRLQMTGVRRSDVSREKMRMAKLGKPAMPRTEEWKAKISAAQKGKKRRPWTDEERARHEAGINRDKMSASAKARWGRERERSKE